MSKAVSVAAERNREPILAVLQALFPGPLPTRILEIGSGTGQHAVYFGAALPHVTWQTSDVAANHSMIQQWIADSALPNVFPPVEMDVNDPPRLEPGHGVYSSNTAHIMSWPEAQKMIALAAALLHPGGRFALYGPFNVGGAFTSDSNRMFDESLRKSVPHQGIRNREEVAWTADDAGMSLISVVEMPANNQMLIFERRTSG